jgi:hypothetical protein
MQSSIDSWTPPSDSFSNIVPICSNDSIGLKINVKLFAIRTTTVESFSYFILSYSELIPEFNIMQMFGTIGRMFWQKSCSESECAQTLSNSCRIFIYVLLSKKSIILRVSKSMPDFKISRGCS